MVAKNDDSQSKEQSYKWTIDFGKELGEKIRKSAEKHHVSITAYITWQIGEAVINENK